MSKTATEIAMRDGLTFGEVVDGLEKKVRHRERQIAAIVTWLERNQPDVFRRGLWDAIGSADRESEPQR